MSRLKVDTSIKDQVAVTTVNQDFYNPNDSRIEGTFIFPAPKGATIDKFTMEIDGKQVSAELLKADKARGIYEDIVRKARDPALFEYAGRDTFRVRIFPIEPRATRHVTVRYTQVLKADDGLVAYVLPLTTDKFSARPVKNISVAVELETKQPLKSIYSPSHKVEVTRNGARRATASFEARDTIDQEDFTLYFAPERGELGFNLMTHKEGDEDGYFMLLASPGADDKDTRVLPKDVVFVLDTSGSMAGKKLEQAKKALLFCVENLNEGDRFEIARFSSEVEPLFDRMTPVSRESRRKAEEFINGLKPIGGTAIDDALKKALALAPGDSEGKERVFVVIFITDGLPTVGITDEDKIVAHVKEGNRGKTRVFCFGVGTDVNTHLLDKITEETRAVSQYVLPEEDLEVKVSRFFSKINQPVLANPELKFSGDVRVTKLYPSPLPDLFRGEQLILVGRYSGNGKSTATVAGSVVDSRREFSSDLKFPDRQEENDFIPRLWATRRIGYLLDEIRLHGENSELRDEVTVLARKYGIVTPYTAYLIVEDEARRDVPTSMRFMQRLQEDSEARQQAASAWSEMRSKRSGDAALADAQYGMELKSAVAAAPTAASSGAAFQRRYGLSSAGTPFANAPATPALSGVGRLIQYSQQTQYVAGKSFALNGEQWVDSAVQDLKSAPRVRLQFGSADYFNFCAKNPDALSWLAVGSNLQFAFKGTVYEVAP